MTSMSTPLAVHFHVSGEATSTWLPAAIEAATSSTCRTFSNVSVNLIRGSLKQFFAGQVGESSVRIGDFIVSVVPDAKVLKVVQGALLGTEEWPGGTPDTDPRPEEVARLRNEI